MKKYRVDFTVDSLVPMTKDPENKGKLAVQTLKSQPIESFVPVRMKRGTHLTEDQFRDYPESVVKNLMERKILVAVNSGEAPKPVAAKDDPDIAGTANSRETKVEAGISNSKGKIQGKLKDTDVTDTSQSEDEF